MTMASEKKIDLYKDTPVRYLGYANEVGEAFRPLIGKGWVLASYGVATAYVLADTVDKCADVYKASKDDIHSFRKTAYAASDTLIWQMLASVVVPGFTINRVCAGAKFLLEKNKRLAVTSRKWLVTAIGLAAIPFIIKPIDRTIDKIMDETFRKLAP